jgi:hypothetical protein
MMSNRTLYEVHGEDLEITRPLHQSLNVPDDVGHLYKYIDAKSQQ